MITIQEAYTADNGDSVAEIQFDETLLLLKEQSDDFRSWFSTSIESQITDQITPDGYDECKRPNKYTISSDNFTFELVPNYINNDKSSWAISGYNLTLKIN